MSSLLNVLVILAFTSLELLRIFCCKAQLCQRGKFTGKWLLHQPRRTSLQNRVRSLLSLSLHLRSTPCKKYEVLQSSVSHSWHLHHTCRHLKGAPPEPSSVPQEERGVPSAARLAPSAAAVRAVLSAMETEGSWEKNNQPTNTKHKKTHQQQTKHQKKNPTTKTHYGTKIKK